MLELRLPVLKAGDKYHRKLWYSESIPFASEMLSSWVKGSESPQSFMVSSMC